MKGPKRKKERLTIDKKDLIVLYNELPYEIRTEILKSVPYDINTSVPKTIRDYFGYFKADYFRTIFFIRSNIKASREFASVNPPPRKTVYLNYKQEEYGSLNLEGMSAHLKYLKVKCNGWFNGTELFPRDTTKGVGLAKLETLILKGAFSFNPLLIPSSLTKFHFKNIYRYRNVQVEFDGRCLKGGKSFKLKKMLIEGCPRIKELDLVKNLPNLQKIKIVDCINIKIKKFTKCIQSITIVGNAQIPNNDIQYLKNLRVLKIKENDYFNIREISTLLKECSFVDCDNLTDAWLNHKNYLTKLKYSKGEKGTTKPNFKNCYSLKHLTVEGFTEIRSTDIPKDLESLTCLFCDSIRVVQSTSNMKKIMVWKCNLFHAVLGNIENLEELNFIECTSLHRVESCINMKKIRVSYCNNVSRIIGSVENLKEFDCLYSYPETSANNDGTLDEFIYEPPQIYEENLRIAEMKKLTSLLVSGVWNLKLLELPPILCTLEIKNSNLLKSIKAHKRLYEITIFECRNFSSITGDVSSVDKLEVTSPDKNLTTYKSLRIGEMLNLVNLWIIDATLFKLEKTNLELTNITIIRSDSLNEINLNKKMNYVHIDECKNFRKFKGSSTYIKKIEVKDSVIFNSEEWPLYVDNLLIKNSFHLIGMFNALSVFWNAKFEDCKNLIPCTWPKKINSLEAYNCLNITVLYLVGSFIGSIKVRGSPRIASYFGYGNLTFEDLLSIPRANLIELNRLSQLKKTNTFYK